MDSLIEQITNCINQSSNSKIIYGDVVEKDGVVVIPVAQLRYGFGVGTKKSSSGGGAGLMAQPIGFIEIKNGEATFKKIPPPLSVPAAILAAGFAGLLLLRAIAKFKK